MLKRTVIALALAMALGFATSGTARALISISGPYLIDAQGGAIDSGVPGWEAPIEFGHMALAGWFAANGKGGASKLFITIGYQDSADVFDGITCRLVTPGDLSYTVDPVTGNGSLTLTVNSDYSGNDTCFETADPYDTVDNTGAQLTFDLYDALGKVRIASNGTPESIWNQMCDGFNGLMDADNDLIAPLALSGKLQRTSTYAAPIGAAPPNVATIATRIALADGGATDPFDLIGSAAGHMTMSGNAVLNTTGGATSVNLTINYEDNDLDSFVCQLSNPKDLSYSLSSSAAGTLTLTVSKYDTCIDSLDGDTLNNAGQSLTFDLYSGGNTVRIISVASDLEDSSGDPVLDPNMVGEFDAAIAAD